MNIEETLLHERLFRGKSIMKEIENMRVCICGAGCIGANLAENLTRCGFRNLMIIDKDRVEPHNLSTQPYLLSDVGGAKASILANYLFYAMEAAVEANTAELTEKNARKLLRGSSLVVDTFDNHVSRGIVKEVCLDLGIPCLHLGLSQDGYAEARWNESYAVPEDIFEQGFCEYPLARNLILILVGAATEAIFTFVSSGECQDLSVTLRDLKINIEKS